MGTYDQWINSSLSTFVDNFLSNHFTHSLTIAAAVLALWGTSFGISRQIKSNSKHAERIRLAKLSAAKSTLPIVLSNLHRMIENRVRRLAIGEKKLDQFDGELIGYEPAGWEISEFELTTLKECIEYADDREKELMAKIISVYQILLSRWKDVKVINLFEFDHKDYDNDNDRYWRREQFKAILNWVTLQARVDQLFGFSRDSSRGEPSQQSEDDTYLRNRVFYYMDWLSKNPQNLGEGPLLIQSNSEYKKFVKSLKGGAEIAFIDYN